VVKWIRLRETLSGGRADGRPWPVAGEVVDVPDWEYDHCIAAGWAEHADPPAPPKAARAREPEEAPEPEKPAEVSREPESGDGSSLFEQTGGTITNPEPPRPSDPKPDWVDYAADRGLARDKAEAMSKADLMSRYGGRL